jgi:hypothetical protein
MERFEMIKFKVPICQHRVYNGYVVMEADTPQEASHLAHKWLSDEKTDDGEMEKKIAWQTDDWESTHIISDVDLVEPLD